MFRHAARTLASFFLVAVVLTRSACPTLAQEGKKSPGSIQLSFLPPPLEKATYSLGVFEAKSGKLIRHLQEIALEKDFTVGLNGLITNWDGKDDAGKPVPPGRYNAHGYAVGPLKIEGEDIQGNDWAAEDESLRFKRVEAIALLPGKAGLAVLAENSRSNLEVARFDVDGKLVWRKTVDRPSEGTDKPWLQADAKHISVFLSRPANGKELTATATYQVENGDASERRVMVVEERVALPAPAPNAKVVSPRSTADFSPAISTPEVSIRSGANEHPPASERQTSFPVSDALIQRSSGKNGTTWTVAGLLGLGQTAPDGTVLRKLEVTEGDPLPVAVSADTNDDRLYLLEEKTGWQRVRGLSWVETKEENGKPVSTWQTFFERNIRTSEAGTPTDVAPVEISLVENPLTPGKPQKLRLTATFDAKGSYLTAENGLKLRRVSERANLQNVRVTKGKSAGSLAFFQYDGAATDEFSITGTHHIMEFDAGEIEMTATGEKPVDTKAAEPPDL